MDEIQPLFITEEQREIIANALYLASHEVLEMGTEYREMHDIIDALYMLDFKEA
jgi:hypothetical protein